jgi:VWFA-related protein
MALPLATMTRRHFALSACATFRIAAQQAIFRAETRLVLLDVQVIDRDSGKTLNSLLRDDFQVEDDGRLQEVKIFEYASTPLDLMLLVDVSGSMIEASRAMVQTLRWAVQDLRSSDRVALITFSKNSSVVLPFTDSRSKLLEAAERAVEHTSRLEQGTRLYDALVTAAGLFRAEGRAVPDRRRAVLAVTDDKESNSKSKAQTVITELLESNAIANAVVINTREPAGRRRITRLGVPIPGVPPITDDRQPPPKHVYLSMERIVAETGGEMTNRREREDFLGEVFARIRSRYLLGFYADTETGGAVFHRLTVRLSPARQRDYPRALVRARTGYYAAH